MNALPGYGNADGPLLAAGKRKQVPAPVTRGAPECWHGPCGAPVRRPTLSAAKDLSRQPAGTLPEVRPWSIH